MNTNDNGSWNIRGNKSWSDAVNELTRKGEAYVLVTILGVRGSAPRDSGTKMVITADGIYDTIGGGHLEYKTIALAQELLADENRLQHIEHFPLGPSLGQCCGGSTSILFERFAGSRVNIMLFGAGHVGRALAGILAGLPCRVQWVDPREDQFPTPMAGNITPLVSEEPKDEVASMPANSYYIVMTHNHQMDFEIAEAILKRGDFSYLGLIGSDTKWTRFQQRFAHKGVDPETVERIHCPVGLAQVPGKHPMEVAVSIAGEVIAHYQRDIPPQPTQQGVHWKTLKKMLGEPQATSDKRQVEQPT